jgi:hypothetical protein
MDPKKTWGLTMTTPAFPRIYIKGLVSWDPGLTNGSGFGFYDPVTATIDRSQIPAGTSLQDFRDSLPLLRQSWNHYGTHIAEFRDVKVTGVSNGPGNVSITDPIVEKPVEMKGKLVDVSAANDNGTQVFFDKIVVGDAFSKIEAKRQRRMTARFINFDRNTSLSGAAGASAVWEVSLPEDGISIQNFGNSTVLSDLESALSLPEHIGLSFRFHTYRTLYYRNGIDNSYKHRPRSREELTELYSHGHNFSNPAYSIVCGVIRPWRVDEHQDHPTGRVLYRQNGGIGKTFVSIDRAAERAVIDLGETIPEVDADATKQDIGEVRVTSEHNGTEVELVTLQPSDYDRASYDRTAGLIDVDLSGLSSDGWKTLEEGTLKLSSATASAEERTYVVVVGERDTYVDEGDSVSIELRVMDHGKPAPNGTLVKIVEFDELTATEIRELPPLTTDNSGYATFDIPVAGPGIRSYVFDAYEPTSAAPPTRPYGFASRADEYFALVRTLPNDDALEASVTDADLTWRWIYETIFAEFDVLNPVMTRRSEPSINTPLHDRTLMESKAKRVKELIDQRAFETASYMPVTRDLSRGRRKILERWCDLVLRDDAPGDLLLAGLTPTVMRERYQPLETDQPDNG